MTPGDWCAGYVSTYVERDVRQLIAVRDLSAFQRFLRMCAARTGQLLNLSSLAAGLYVALYCLGGCAGSVLPGFLWKQTGWFGCVAMIVSMQVITVLIANKLWQD